MAGATLGLGKDEAVTKRNKRREEAESFLVEVLAYDEPDEGKTDADMCAAGLALVNEFLDVVQAKGTDLPDRKDLAWACIWLLTTDEPQRALKRAELVYELVQPDVGVSFHAIAPQVTAIRDEYMARSAVSYRASALTPNPDFDLF